MTTEKISNVEILFKRGNEYESDVFKVSGLGPEGGRGDFGMAKIYYKDRVNWIPFASCQVGAYDHGAPAMIEDVRKTAEFPRGYHDVTVALDKDGPTGKSASVPQSVDFQ